MAGQKIPLDQQDVIPVPRTHQNLVNFSSIVKTGKVPLGHAPEDYSIDWKKNDAFTAAVKKIEENTQKKIDADPDLQDLLHKPSWTKDDREKWESTVSDMVKEETAAIPGFKDYRTIGLDGKIKNITQLNTLACDINGGTECQRFDCGVKSLVKGSVMQNLEARNLPKTAPQRDYRKASNYFLATGVAVAPGETETVGGHAFVIAPSGNIIEETINTTDESAYRKTAYPNTLENFVRGNGVMTENGFVYGTTNGLAPGLFGWSMDQDARKLGVEKVRDLTQGVANHQREEGVIFSEKELLDHGNMPGFQVLEDDKSGMIMVVSGVKKDKADDYEVKLYQKQNVGEPDEGYVQTGYGHLTKKPGTKTVSLSADYTDILDHDQRYRASATFTSLRDVKMDIYRLDRHSDAKGPGYHYVEQKLAEKKAALTPGASASAASDAFNDVAAAAPAEPAPPQSKFGQIAAASEAAAPEAVTSDVQAPAPRQKDPSPRLS